MHPEVPGNTIIEPNDGQEKILIEKLITVINSALAPLYLRLIQTNDEYDDKNSYIVLVGLIDIFKFELILISTTFLDI